MRKTESKKYEGTKKKGKSQGKMCVSIMFVKFLFSKCSAFPSIHPSHVCET